MTDVDVEHFNHALSCRLFLSGQLQISIAKCCVLQLNPRYASSTATHFAINGTPLTAHGSIRDLGVIVNESLTPSTNIANITATAHQRVNQIFRAFVSRDIVMLLNDSTDSPDCLPILLSISVFSLCSSCSQLVVSACIID